MHTVSRAVRRRSGTGLALDGRADGDVAYFDVVWLFDGEGDGAGDGLWWNGELVHGAANLVADGGVVDGVGQFGANIPGGEIEVVRSTPSVDSCRSPSRRVRTASLVAA